MQVIGRTFVSDHSRDTAVITNCWAESAKLAISPSFIALAFHNGLEDHNANVTTSKGDYPSGSLEDI